MFVCIELWKIIFSFKFLKIKKVELHFTRCAVIKVSIEKKVIWRVMSNAIFSIPNLYDYMIPLAIPSLFKQEYIQEWESRVKWLQITNNFPPGESGVSPREITFGNCQGLFCPICPSDDGVFYSTFGDNLPFWHSVQVVSSRLQQGTPLSDMLGRMTTALEDIWQKSS